MRQHARHVSAQNPTINRKQTPYVENIDELEESTFSRLDDQGSLKASDLGRPAR